MDWKKVGVLFASLLVALAPWGQSLGDWNAAFAVSNAWPALGIIGGVVLAWLGQSPVKPK